MKKIFYFFAVIIISAVVFNGFFPMLVNAKVKPVSPVSYQDVQYVQLIQPAFVKEFSGKLVRFEAVFLGIINTTIDLPSTYKDYIRLQIGSSREVVIGNVSAPTIGNLYNDVVIAKEKSGPVFNIKQGQKIKIAASAVKCKSVSIAGGTESSLILVVDSIKVIDL